MLRVFTITIGVLIGIVAVTAISIVAVRIGRQVRQRRRAALAAGPRRALLAFVAGNGEEGSHDLVAIPDDAWSAAEPGALGLLGKLRGEAHLALVSVFLRRGTARAALGDLRSRSRVRRARAAQVLGDLELRQAVPELCRLLTDRHGEVRVVAVRALGRIGDPAAAWRLIASLDQPDPVPSLLASHTLVQLGSGAEVTLSAALDHPEARVRAVCLDALGLLGAAGSVQRVARVLSDDGTLDVRVAAATNLGRLGARSALEPLTAALSPARPPALRAAAARALGELGAAAAVPALVALLGDGEFRVAHEAAHALRRLGRAGLDALREVVAQERIEGLAVGRGLHAKPSAPASHAEEALALASVSVATGELVVAG
jgi:HEAT repeat protein